MKDYGMDDFKLFEGFCFLNDALIDIGDCRVAFMTEKGINFMLSYKEQL